MSVSTHFKYSFMCIKRRLLYIVYYLTEKFEKSVIKRFIYRREHVERWEDWRYELWVVGCGHLFIFRNQ